MLFVPERERLRRNRISLSKSGRSNPKVAGDANVRRRPEERARISGGGNPNAKKPLIHGVSYPSLNDAAAALGVSQGTTIRRRIDHGEPGYAWARTVWWCRFMRFKKGHQPTMFDVDRGRATA